MRFSDRHEAGRILGRIVAESSPVSPVVTALPRGGVPVGFEVASALGCPLDLLLVRKIGLPGQPELAIGAVAEGGFRVLNPDVIARAGVDAGELARATDKAMLELEARAEMYRSDFPPVELAGRTVLVVDDGLATGSTARVAIEVVRELKPLGIWLCVPVAPRDTIVALSESVDRLIVVEQPRRFIAVGYWYDDFDQTSDGEVRELLRRSRARG